MAGKKKNDVTPVLLPVEVAVAAEHGLHLRSGPSLDSPVLAVLPRGAGVFVDPAQLAPDGTIPEWLQVKTGNLTGYVVSKYLEEVG